jgi:uncharacterized membrane protein
MLSVLNTKVVVRPNASLSVEGGLKLIVGLMIFSLAVAVAFAMSGAWMVLPFAGLELLGLVVAFVLVHRHANDYEMITISDADVEVEQCLLGQVVKHRFQRYWIKVSLREESVGKVKLVIGSHGKEVEFGRTMINNEQRVALLHELKRKFAMNNN